MIVPAVTIAPATSMCIEKGNTSSRSLGSSDSVSRVVALDWRSAALRSLQWPRNAAIINLCDYTKGKSYKKKKEDVSFYRENTLKDVKFKKMLPRRNQLLV